MKRKPTEAEVIEIIRELREKSPQYFQSEIDDALKMIIDGITPPAAPVECVTKERVREIYRKLLDSEFCGEEFTEVFYEALAAEPPVVAPDVTAIVQQVRNEYHDNNYNSNWIFDRILELAETKEPQQ